MSDPVESYFSELRDIRSSGAGVAEISYYDPLKQLLNEVGKSLKPKVRALMQLRNTGSGNPDGGLFTANQLKNWDPGVDPLLGQMPARGAIEVKGTSDDAFKIAASEQVARYVKSYGLVLVTNLRDFVLVGKSAEGIGVRTLESCSLAKSEAAFWAKVQHPRTYAESAGEGLTEFLRRVLLHNAPLSDPKDIAWFLASYARTARLRLEQRHELPALDALRNQLEESLGLKFEGEKGDHFFRSTLVQTLFYGMFASWVLWARDMDHTEAIPWDRRFQWETATATLHVPMVYELFRQFADVRQLGALGISEVLEWAEEIIWRIDRKSFFEKFREEHAVQYFYEPFLEAFDPQLRKDLGVWYTPDEVVKYMVARVDWALREELGIADGLADPSVVVLDPCCGTGAYLVEVLRKIDETLQAKGADALTRQDVKRAAMERVIGFEIMPAPFVVAHLQLGILLAELGVPLRDADERAAVYLTNALTGWNRDVAPPKERQGVAGQLHSTLLFPEFAEERDAADRIKREEQILVVVGNPPYNSYAGVAGEEEADLVEPYKRGLVGEWGVRKFNLDDLYVRFVRLAERTIAERSCRGVACVISNFSYLADGSFVVMRKHLTEAFGGIWIDNLNGDSRETGKLTPDGKPDPSIFSTAHNREGIRVGTSIGLFVSAGNGGIGCPAVRYRELWGANKAGRLCKDAGGFDQSEYQELSASPENRFAMKPRKISAEYLRWPSITALFPSQWGGVQSSRDQFVVDIDLDALADRVDAYFDPSVDDSVIVSIAPSAMARTELFDGPSVRKCLNQRGKPTAISVRYLYRPFDERWVYWEPECGLFNRARPEYQAQIADGNMWFSAAQRNRQGEFYRPQVTTLLADYHIVESHAGLFPLRVRNRTAQQSLLATGDRVWTFNQSPELREYVDELGGKPEEPYMHAIAVLHSQVYARENLGALKQEWPRLPMPASIEALAKSASLGERVAVLLDPGQVVVGQLTGTATLGTLAMSSGGVLDPATDLAITVRWGIAGRGGITMPSTGKLIERGYVGDELAGVAESLGMSAERAMSLLGETCFDIYLNDVAYWRCVPANVWRYTIGGYQVIKKWLSYRERALLGRDLKPEEARYVTEMVRRIGALVLMQPELDANYERVKADVWEWGK